MPSAREPSLLLYLHQRTLDSHFGYSCRSKDSRKPLSASLPSMSSMSAMNTTPPTSPPLSPRPIVAPMTPTRVPSLPIPAIRIPSDVHDAKSDLDPTEWKPVLPGRTASSTSLASSDAWNYLSKFHGGDETMLTRRPASHRSTASLPALVGGASNVPALTHTPSTVASSVSSTASDYMAMASLSETSVARPLPPRHNPSYCSSAKGVELVVPHVDSTNEDVAVELADSGSIFPASSAVWEDTSYAEKRTQPITMARTIGGGPAQKA